MLAFLINYNRLTLPRKLANDIARAGVEPVFLDNDSTYQPLLAWYETCPYQVVHMGFNYGSAAPWHPAPAILERFNLDGGFVVTDPDLDISAVPLDWPKMLQEGLDRYPHACKSGLSLKIDDLPDTKVGNQARLHEAGYWARPLGGGFYDAFIDTTFCLCRTCLHDFPAVRAAPPYCARHVPWYYDKLEDIPEDELFYIQSTKSRGSTYWTDKIAQAVGI